MKEENKQSKELLNQIDIDMDRVRNKIADLLSWFFSNLFSLLFPVGAIFLLEYFKKNGNFDIRTSYPEMLMVTISICMCLLIQLNSKDYKTKEASNTLIRVVTVGMIVVSSLAYGISKTIPESELNIDPVFKISVILLTTAFVVGLACEYKRKERD